MLDEYKVKYLSDISKSLEEIGEILRNERPISDSSQWYKEGSHYPKCNHCGYEWKEQVVGPVGQGHSDISEANYCPHCGYKMMGVILR